MHARVLDPGGPNVPSHCGTPDAAFRLLHNVGSASLASFEAQSPGLHLSLSTLRSRRLRRPRKTRSRPLAKLCRSGLPPVSRRFPQDSICKV
jgi:hypothetical protein